MSLKPRSSTICCLIRSRRPRGFVRTVYFGDRCSGFQAEAGRPTPAASRVLGEGLQIPEIAAVSVSRLVVLGPIQESVAQRRGLQFGIEGRFGGDQHQLMELVDGRLF